MIPGLLEGAVIAVAAFLAGQWLPRPRLRRGLPKQPKQPEPFCGCSHHHSFHDPATGECHATVDGDPIGRDRFGHPDAWEQVRCPCRQYSGPVPLPGFYAPEITS
jgi:hypothetical protein